MTPMDRRRQAYHSDSESEYSESDDGNMSSAQIALRDKEEALVQSALARIRRAQEKGKSEVNLKHEEVAALERRRKRMQSAATAKARKGSGSSGGSGSERRRKSENMVTVPIVQPESSRPQARHRGNRAREGAESPRRPLSTASGPGLVVDGPSGPSFAPIGGYYPPSSSSNRSSPTRPRSSSSQVPSRRTPPQTAYPKLPSNRHVSEGTRPPSSGPAQRSALPHEEDWIPSSRSRRNSINAQTYSHDPFEYQTGGPPPSTAQYAYGHGSKRRYVSGPPEIQYSSLRRSPPVGHHVTSPSARPGAPPSASDPTLDRRKIEVIEIPDSESGTSSEDDDDDDDSSDDTGNHGVAVKSVEQSPPRHITAVPARKPVGGGRKRARRS